MSKKRIGGDKITPTDIKRFNMNAKRNRSPMVLINGQWFSWEESDSRSKEIWVVDQDGGEKPVYLDMIDMVEENVFFNQSLTSPRSIAESAKINYEKADELIGKTVQKYTKSPKATFILKQIFTAMRKDFGRAENSFIMKANNLVLKYNLDIKYDIPLFRTNLKTRDIK
jgi:hypothetical protein